MKLYYPDLIKFLSDKPSKELLSEKLFQLGHEHEVHGDIFDMELTPNRGDCLSLIGLSRDLAVFFGKNDNLNTYEGDITPLEINFKNLSPLDCPKISFLEIEIEESKSEYEPYLENYFRTVGGNKTNLFSDISNYISYELGQPTHCFDAETIKGDLIFENKDCNNSFSTLLGSEIKLTENNCVFSVDNKIVSLAGVMGGASTACSQDTKKVLIECAYFNPESIIGKSLKYNLVSDASHKFERGVDIECQEKVLRRFAKVIADHVKIKKIKLKSFSSNEYMHTFIPIDVNKINAVLGTLITESEYLDHLQKLDFKITNNSIKVPSFRNDIKTQNDLAEEIARIIGFNKIKSAPISLKKFIDNEKCNKVKKIESFLCKNGFSEVINFPFTSKKVKHSIKIDNPLDKNRENFRTSIIDSLTENLLYNERRQKDFIKIFEISDIYTKQTEIKKEKKLGILISGRLGNNYKEFSKKLDRNYLNQLLNSGFENDFFKINEISRDALDTKKKDKIFYVEALVDDIPDTFFSNLKEDNKKINFISYKPISEFPSSTRDFSFSITNIDMVDEIIKILNNITDEIIKHVFIFDFYKNNKTATIKIGYRFVFQSHKKTLSDEEINQKVQEIIKPIIELDGVSIPGM